MAIQSIKSTVRIDPVQQAINRANRHLAHGRREEAIATLEEMLSHHPERQDLKNALEHTRQAAAVEVVTQTRGSGLSWGILVAAIIAAGVLAYWLLG